MIELKKGFDLIGSINNFVAKRRQEFGVSDSVPTSPRVLCQEKDGGILYSWTDFNPPNKKTSLLVTHVGLFDPATQDHKLVWINNKRLKIVSCSINKARSLLAFTTLSKVEGKSGKDMYRGFLAEILAADVRVFSLNLSKEHFLKVQFLYPSHPDHSSSRESHLLVCLHKESVGLYKIPLARVGDGTVMSGQPKTEQIAGKFVWCQWDAANQRLHYIHNYRINSESNEDIRIGQKLSTIQFHHNANYDNMIDFPLNFPFPYIKSSSRSHYADRPLNPGIPDVSVNASVLTQANGTFCLCYQHLSVSSSKSRTSPTTQEDEDSIHYYICMVHHVKTINGCVSGLPKSLIGSRRLFFHWLGDYILVLLPGFFIHLLNVGLEFEPCHHILLHNHERTVVDRSASVLYPSGDHCPDLPTLTSSLEDIADQSTRETKATTVRFQLVEESPGGWTSSRSMSLSSISSSRSVLDFLDTMSAISGQARHIHSLSPCLGFTREIGGTVYDYRNGQVWRLFVSMEGLVESFKSAYAQTRQAILHYVLVRTKDVYTLKKLFLDICENLTKSELPQSMAEYLVASTYSSMKRQLERDMMRLLPFTAAETFRGQFERNPSGERLARLSYTSLQSVKFTKKTARERQNATHRSVSEDMWDTLRRRLHLQLVDHPTRFVLEAVGKKVSKSLKEERSAQWETVASMSVKENSEQDFLSSMQSFERGSTPVTKEDVVSAWGSRTESVLGPPPAFLQGTYGEDNSHSRVVNSMTEDLLASYLSSHLRTENKAKARNVAKEYISCQTQKTNQLCHILWSLRQSEPAWLDSESMPNLCEAGNDDENDLFQIYERLHLTLSELCFPVPPGFQTCLTVLGFRCLNFRMFLQYVDRGVLSLTGQFVTQLLTDVPDNCRQNSEIKYQVISRLPKSLAEVCMRTWDTPFCNRFFANIQVSEILLDGVRMTKGKEDYVRRSFPRDQSTEPADDNVASHVTFAPLASFIRHLEQFSKDQAKRTARSRTMVETNLDVNKSLLEEVGLQQTRQLHQYDMSSVHF